MQHSLIFFLPFLLLFFHHQITVVHSLEDQPIQVKPYCSSTKYWTCNLTETVAAPYWVIQASTNAIQESFQEYSRQTEAMNDDLSFHTAYQTPVDEQTGNLFVALRLDWRLSKDLIPLNNVTFWLGINQFEHDEAVSTIFMKIYGNRSDESLKKGKISFHTDFQAFIDNKLQIGRSYGLTLIYKSDNNSRAIVSSKTLTIPMIHLDAQDNRKVICDREHIEKSRKVAARWVSAIYTETRNLARVVIVTFYAAPKWFCFDRYEVKLIQNNAAMQSIIVTNDQLYRNGSNWMSNITFSGVSAEVNHSVTVKPLEYRLDNDDVCLCRISSACNCVLAKSKDFSWEDTGHFVFGKVLEERFRAKHRSKSSEKETGKKEIKPLILVFLIFSIIAAILIIMFLLLCLYRTLKQSAKWQKTLLLKSTGSGESLTPLIKNPPVQRVFILNPNSDKSDFVTEVAEILRSKGLYVSYFLFDSKQVEENAFYYIHKAISDADKIILFHGNKTQKFIQEGKIMRDIVSSDLYDNAFIIALSLLKLNDTKILHVNFQDDSTPTKLLVTEILYTLPRDLSYLFQGLRLPIEQTSINHLKESYSTPKEYTAIVEENGISTSHSSSNISKDEVVVAVEIPDVVIENCKTTNETFNTDSGFHSM